MQSILHHSVYAAAVSPHWFCHFVSIRYLVSISVDPLLSQLHESLPNLWESIPSSSPAPANHTSTHGPSVRSIIVAQPFAAIPAIRYATEINIKRQGNQRFHFDRLPPKAINYHRALGQRNITSVIVDRFPIAVRSTIRR